MERYRLSEQEQAVFEGLQTPFAVFQLVDKRVVTLALSDGFCDYIGCESRDAAYRAMDQDALTNVHPDDTARVRNTVANFMRDGGVFDSIYRLKHKTGYRVIHAMGKHVFPAPGVRLAQVWYMDEGDYAENGNGSELNQSLTNALHEASILKANHYDDLTGLPNLTYFFDLAEAGKAALRKNDEYAMLLYIDLNGMKYYNQKYGFAEGDRLLKALSRLLCDTFGADHCGHVGADRFAVYTGEEGLEARLSRLFDQAALLNDGRSLPVRVGVYPARIEEVAVSFAYDRAKIACDALKKTDSSEFNYYSEELRDYMKKSQYIVTNIDRAIAEKWIQVYYQPIIRVVNGQVCDVEALSRWVDPVEGFLSPADFIPILEESGLIYKLDLYVLEQVLEKIAVQTKVGLYTIPHSVNLSRSDFDVCDIVEEIRQRVDAAGIERKNINIEITESMIGSDFDFMKKQMDRFRKLGFPVWMDDFGSGYSSLDVLQSIKFDLLKFDMGFMRKLDEGNDGKIILTELMKMATSLGIETICEGVETAEQVRFLQEIGCSKLQGYYFSKPVSRAEIRQRHQNGTQIGHENPEEAAYFEAIGRVNLFDLGVIADSGESALRDYYNTVPMAIIEIKDGKSRITRSNQSYRDFMMRFFHTDISSLSIDFCVFFTGTGESFINKVAQCCQNGGRLFHDEVMPDGSVIHSFIRKIATNPVTGVSAAAVAVLSVTKRG